MSRLLAVLGTWMISAGAMAGLAAPNPGQLPEPGVLGLVAVGLGAAYLISRNGKK